MARQLREGVPLAIVYQAGRVLPASPASSLGRLWRRGLTPPHDALGSPAALSTWRESVFAGGGDSDQARTALFGRGLLDVDA
jgi:hypothetical protein